MKRIVYILISILLALYIMLSALGSGGEYAAEKIFYRAMKTNAKIMANPDVAPPKLLEYVENNLKKVLEKYPGTKVAATVNITLAEFYILNKRYDDALTRLNSIIKAYSNVPSVLSTAHFLKGRTYEKQNRWANALKEYNIVHDDYTDTELGVQIPIYIAERYTDKGRDSEARQAYNEAALFYEKLERNNSRKVLGYIASKLSIQAYMGAGNYEQAGMALEKTINNYMNNMTLVQLLPQVEEIFVIKLKRPEKAVEIYKSIKEKVKDENFRNFLDKKISDINDDRK